MSEQDVQLSVEQDADVTIISVLTARVPVGLSEVFEERVVKTVSRLEQPKVLIDFQGVEFISSAILGKLIKLNGWVMDQEGQLKLSSLSERIREVFHITGLDKLFSIHPTRDEAVKAFH